MHSAGWWASTHLPGYIGSHCACGGGRRLRSMRIACAALWLYCAFLAGVHHTCERRLSSSGRNTLAVAAEPSLLSVVLFPPFPPSPCMSFSLLFSHSSLSLPILGCGLRARVIRWVGCQPCWMDTPCATLSIKGCCA